MKSFHYITLHTNLQRALHVNSQANLDRCDDYYDNPRLVHSVTMMSPRETLPSSRRGFATPWSAHSIVATVILNSQLNFI